MHPACVILLSIRLEKVPRYSYPYLSTSSFCHTPEALEYGSGLGFAPTPSPGSDTPMALIGSKAALSKLEKNHGQEATVDMAGIAAYLTICSVFCPLTMGSSCSQPLIFCSALSSSQPTSRDPAHQY